MKLYHRFIESPLFGPLGDEIIGILELDKVSTGVVLSYIARITRKERIRDVKSRP